MSRTLARASLAMKIARLDRIAFNEAVANEHLRCVPRTRPGSARLFDEDDLAMLCIFSQLIDFGMTPRTAGPLACEFRSYLDTYPDEDRLVLVKGSLTGTILRGSEFNPDHRAAGIHYPGLGDIMFTLDFHLVAIRARISRELEYEDNIRGREDDEG